MSSLRAFPSDIDISPSENQLRDLKLVKDFTDPRSGVVVELEGFELSREGKEELLNWLYNTQGRFENPEAYFESPDGHIYNMFINLRELGIKRRKGISGTIEMRKSYKHFFDNADVLTFELLRQQGFITDAMLIDFPYLNVPDDLKQQRAIQQITLLALFFQLYISIKEAADLVAQALNPTNVLVVVGQAAALALYLLLTIASIIDVSVNLLELYFPAIRYYKAVSDYDLMSAACQKLGYTFTSDFMVNEMFGMHTIGKPEAITESITDRIEAYFVDKYFNEGYPRNDDTVTTTGQLFDFYLSNFDTAIFIHDGVVRFERESFFQNSPSFTVKPTMSNQTEYDDEYQFNEDQVWGRKYYKWSTDYEDVHSIEVNQGDAKFEAVTTQINTINDDLVNLTGLDEYTAPFALVKRKEGYTGTELFVKDLFAVIDNVLSNLSNILSNYQNSPNIPNLQSIISQRVGVGVFERQYWAITRKVWGVPAQVGDKMILKQPSNFLDFISQTAINANFNTGLYLQNNNYALKTLDLPFTDTQFNNLLANYFVNYEGQEDPVKVLKVEFYPFQYRAIMGVELPDGSAFNTQTTIL